MNRRTSPSSYCSCVPYLVYHNVLLAQRYQNHYSLFTLSMPGSQNRKYYIIGTHIYYILLVCHVNAISTSCSRVICRHCLLAFCLRFYCLLWTNSLVFSTFTYSTILIYFVAVPCTMLGERCVRSGEKEIIL